MFALWSKRGAQLPETIVQTAWGTDIVMELQEQLGLTHFTLVTHQQGSGFAGHNSTLKAHQPLSTEEHRWCSEVNAMIVKALSDLTGLQSFRLLINYTISMWTEPTRARAMGWT